MDWCCVLPSVLTCAASYLRRIHEHRALPHAAWSRAVQPRQDWQAELPCQSCRQVGVTAQDRLLCFVFVCCVAWERSYGCGAGQDAHQGHHARQHIVRQGSLIRTPLWKPVPICNCGGSQSCLIKRYCEKRFVAKYMPTIGIDYGVTR